MKTSVAGLVERVLPDILVKGGQYAVEEIVGHEVVTGHGGRVLPLAMKFDLFDDRVDREDPQSSLPRSAVPQAKRRMKARSNWSMI